MGRWKDLSLFRSVAETWLPYSKNTQSKWVHNYQRNKFLSTLTEHPFTVRTNSSVFARNKLRANRLLSCETQSLQSRNLIPYFTRPCSVNMICGGLYYLVTYRPDSSIYQLEPKSLDSKDFGKSCSILCLWQCNSSFVGWQLCCVLERNYLKLRFCLRIRRDKFPN